MKKLLLLASLPLLLFSCAPEALPQEGDNKQSATDKTPDEHAAPAGQVVDSPVVTTGEASDITGGSAVLTGTADLAAVGEYDDFGVIVSMDAHATLAYGYCVPAEKTGDDKSFTLKLTRLKDNTTYYYKTYIRSGNVLRVGEVKSFTTVDYTVNFKEVITTPKSYGLSLQAIVENDVSFNDISYWYWHRYRTYNQEEWDFKFGFYYGSSPEPEALMGENGYFVIGDNYSKDSNWRDSTEWEFEGMIQSSDSIIYHMPYICIGKKEYHGEVYSYKKEE